MAEVHDVEVLRGRRAGHVHKGPPGTWEALSSPTDEFRRYRQTKETKCGGTGGGESEHFIVPLMRGNQPEGSRGGKEMPEHGTEGGNDGRDTGL
jgi:hypothetical protein